MTLRRGVLLSLAYVLVLAIVALLVPLGVSLRNRVDAEVRLQARSQTEVVAAQAAPLMSPAQPVALSALTRDAAMAVRGRVVIVDAQGLVIADSAGPHLVGTSYASRPEIDAALGGDISQLRRQSSTLNEEILATAAPILDGPKRAGAVRITQSIASVNEAVRKTWLGLGAIGALVLGLGLLAGTLLARRISRPILRLNAAAERVGAGDLSARARIEGSAEQRALARTFNSMTERVATLLDNQKDFVADASHQLRTPLAGLRLRLEDVRATTTDVEQTRELDFCLHETDRLADIVNELLELSRAGEDRRAAAVTDPRAAVDRVVDRFAAPALAAGCTLRSVRGATPAMPVACHRSDLDRMLDILLENAIAYAPGTAIDVEADGANVRVHDHGPGLAPGEEATAFERFHRGRAGLAGAPGSGLGLAIARDLARRWGGDVTIANGPHGGATSVIALVAASPS